MFWLIFIIIVFVLIIFFYFIVRKFRNPYKLIMIFGKKGSGKSTTLVKLALKYHKMGWNIYSTEVVPYAYKIEPSDIGFYQFKPHSLLLVDEVGMVWDNRAYKSFKPEVRDFFKLQRHYKIRCYLFSQSFDIDKKLRDLTDQMFLQTNLFGFLTYGKRISRSIVLTKSSSEAPSTISEDLRFDSFLAFMFGSRTITYIPKYAKYFNSFEAPKLPEKEWSYNEIKVIKKSHNPFSSLFSRFRRSRHRRY